jgi:hypothetical protein
MSNRISLRLAIVVLTAAVASPLSVLAQSQGQQTDSVADAARRAREKKKAAEKQPAPIITDDILKPSAPAAQQANAPAPSSEAAPAPAAQPVADSSGARSSSDAAKLAPGSPAGDGDQKAQVSAELTALKQQLLEAQKALELLQRDMSLQQDTYISNPDHSHDVAGKAKLDAMLEQVTDKQLSVDNLKAQLAALQGSLGTIAPAAPATAPPPPQQLP